MVTNIFFDVLPFSVVAFMDTSPSTDTDVTLPHNDGNWMEQQLLPDLMLSQRSQSSDAPFERAEGDSSDPQHDEHEYDEQD